MAGYTKLGMCKNSLLYTTYYLDFGVNDIMVMATILLFRANNLLVEPNRPSTNNIEEANLLFGVNDIMVKATILLFEANNLLVEPNDIM